MGMATAGVRTSDAADETGPPPGATLPHVPDVSDEDGPEPPAEPLLDHQDRDPEEGAACLGEDAVSTEDLVERWAPDTADLYRTPPNEYCFEESVWREDRVAQMTVTYDMTPADIAAGLEQGMHDYLEESPGEFTYSAVKEAPLSALAAGGGGIGAAVAMGDPSLIPVVPPDMALEMFLGIAGAGAGGMNRNV
ncbi:MAG: hypothetical protein ABEK12_00095, partial [Candidatus Nanohaloarchaea archaeon]